jgi:alkylation response protein AidB-like acyl-CoA dehydrogenase
MSLSDEQLTELGVLARAGEADARLPDAAVAVLRDAGLLRLAVAGRFGGEDRSLREILSVVGRLSRVDGALGWSCGQVALSQIMLGYLPEEAQERIYASGPDVYAAGAAAPKGRASRRAAGWSVSGRWPLVSGAAHAEWLFLHCLQAADRSQWRAAPADGRAACRPGDDPRHLGRARPASDRQS